MNCGLPAGREPNNADAKCVFMLDEIKIKCYLFPVGGTSNSEEANQPHVDTQTQAHTPIPPITYVHLDFFFFCLFKNAHGNTRFFPFQLIKGWFLRHCLKHVSSWPKTRCTCTCSISEESLVKGR